MAKRHRKFLLNRIALMRFQHDVGRRMLKKEKRKRAHLHSLTLKSTIKASTKDEYYANLIEKLLPANIKYLFECENSIFSYTALQACLPDNDGVFKVPKYFSLIDNPIESYDFIQSLTASLIYQQYVEVKIDYNECEAADLGAQVLLDIILKDIFAFFKKRRKYARISPIVKKVDGINIVNSDIRKMLFSVGSPAIHNNRTINFSDIIPYKLCIHNRNLVMDPVKIIEQKDLDTTTLVDYVLNCLSRLNKKLTPDKLDDLCTIIGEILINAEEHSTTKNRFSIGYFQELNENNKHLGLFRLVIMNFGNSIYEKFKDPNCPNARIVEKMKNLSKSYTSRGLFSAKAFEEETLWTLYALQEGVTSVAPEEYRKRGHGSIQFIESFFNIKGDTNENDNISRMTIMSGNVKITFDGTYKISEKEIDGESFKFMTFNDSGEIEDKPDSKYVQFVDHYFPGTMISAKILFNENDLADGTNNP